MKFRLIHHVFLPIQFADQLILHLDNSEVVISRHESDNLRVVISATTERELSKKEAELLDSARGKDSAGSDPRYAEWVKYGFRDLEYVGPPVYRNLLDTVTTQLSETTHAIVGLIQWRTSGRGPSKRLERIRRLHWSEDGITWTYAPGVAGALAGDVIASFPVRQSMIEEVLKLAAHDYEQPLGHELWREARHQTGSAKATIVMAIVAIEVGIKRFMATEYPDTEWLLDNMPSPSIERILREFLPGKPLKSGRVFCELPKQMLEWVKKAVHMRNVVTHSGTHAKLDRAHLSQFLRGTRELLSLLDYYAGHDWALDFMSDGLREFLNSDGTAEFPSEWPDVTIYW